MNRQNHCRSSGALKKRGQADPGLTIVQHCQLERSEKTCVSEGESPSSSEAKLPEFRTKVMNGKV